MYACIHACMYVCMYACMYACAWNVTGASSWIKVTARWFLPRVGAQASPRVLGAPLTSVRLSLLQWRILKRNLRRSGKQCRTDHHVSVMVFVAGKHLCTFLGRLGVQLWQNRFSRQPRSWWTIWKSYAAPNFKEKIKCCTLHSKFAVVKECRHILIPNIARRNNFKNSMKTCSNEIFNRQNHPKFHATMNTLACRDRIFFCLGRRSFTTFLWEEQTLSESVNFHNLACTRRINKPKRLRSIIFPGKQKILWGGSFKSTCQGFQKKMFKEEPTLHLCT